LRVILNRKLSSLLSLKLGQKARVTEVRAESHIDQRILSLGIGANVIIKISKVAPLGDPIAIEVDGALIMLRKSEAQGILVEPI
jgi:ferrous iron transport protein A